MFLRRKNHKNEGRKLPRPVQQYMMYRFNLVPEYLDMLRCLEYDEVVNDRPVKRILIYSPDRARGCHLSTKANPELEQHPEMLLFEGYIDSQGSVHVADQRPPFGQVRAR